MFLDVPVISLHSIAASILQHVTKQVRFKISFGRTFPLHTHSAASDVCRILLCLQISVSFSDIPSEL